MQLHDEFDVLAHLTYISKAQSNPYHTPVKLSQHRDGVAEIMKVLVAKGKGLASKVAKELSLLNE